MSEAKQEQIPTGGPPEPPDPLDEHYRTVIAAITDGDVVPFLGAGANLCGRPGGASYQCGQYLPSGSELAQDLAKEFGYTQGDPKDLLRVSQYAVVMRGSAPLYRRLHSIFNADYPPTPLHRFLAALPGLLREKGYPSYQLIVTTNYDDVLECAFRAAKEPTDVVSYIAEGDNRGKFWHCSHGGKADLIDKPNEYINLPFDKSMVPQRTVILKIHGAVDRISVTQSDFVITEDNYIDYLTRTDIPSLLPAQLAVKLRDSSYLFLGYSLRDWNLRVILRRIWGERKLTYQSWAVQLKPELLDRRFWRNRGVEIIDQSLEDYVAELSKRI